MSGTPLTVYLVGHGKVAKIYKAGRLNALTLAKLKLMTSTSLDIEGVCWPESLLYNSKREPVGYLMQRAAGFPLDTSVFKKPLLQKKLPNWKRVDLVRLAIRVSEIINGLHNHNVILGDINPNNILVTPDGRVTFVDIDSAQVADYPCPVGMINFTRPQHHGKDFDSYLRDFDDDRFALAVMLFMILVPGKPPYSHTGGGEPGENIRKKNFPYPVGDKNASGMPDGPWRFIWSHMSRRLKEAFSEAFTEDKLRSPSQWIEVLRTYEQSIKRGRMDSEQGNDIFPSRGKRLSAQVQNRFKIQQEEMIELGCQSCGKIFEIRRSVLERYSNPPKRCTDCWKADKLRDQLGSNAVGSNSSSTTWHAGKGNPSPGRVKLPPTSTPPRYPNPPTITQPSNNLSVVTKSQQQLGSSTSGSNIPSITGPTGKGSPSHAGALLSPTSAPSPHLSPSTVTQSSNSLSALAKSQQVLGRSTPEPNISSTTVQAGKRGNIPVVHTLPPPAAPLRYPDQSTVTQPNNNPSLTELFFKLLGKLKFLG